MPGSRNKKKQINSVEYFIKAHSLRRKIWCSISWSNRIDFWL